MDGRGHEAGHDAGSSAAETYYAELRTIAQTLRSAGQETARQLDPALRDETPDWLLEQLDAVIRSTEAIAAEIGRFIREDRLGYVATPPPGYGDPEE